MTPTITLVDGSPCWCDPETFDYTGHGDLCLVRRRDAEIHYCATCHQRVYDPDAPKNPHNQTVEQCEALLEGKGRERLDGRLCWSPQDHHPFVEGEIPDYEAAERDRRFLLTLIPA